MQVKYILDQISESHRTWEWQGRFQEKKELQEANQEMAVNIPGIY